MEFWNSFWDIIWWFVLAFMFITYLFALFAIIGDLFSDRKLNGWAKAVWIIFLVFIPFLTALVYMIARGDSMAERRAEGAAQAKQATDSYIQSVASTSASDEIAKAKRLHDEGVISAAEYETIKLKALA